MMRTAARLRRETGIIMNADQRESGYDANSDTENLAIGFDVFGTTIACGDAVEPTRSL